MLLDPPYPTSLKRFPRVRQSRLAAFDRCALAAHFAEEYERDWSSHPQARGTIFHRVAARALLAMAENYNDLDATERKAMSISPDDVTEILKEVIRQDGVDDTCGTCGAAATYIGKGRVRCERGHEHGSSFLNLPFKELKDLRWTVRKWASEFTFDMENLVDVEQRMEAVAVYERHGVRVERRLTGALDVLFIMGEAADHAIVLDWKDTWGIPAPKEVGDDGYFQQRMYGWLVMKNFPTVNRVTTREVYPRIKPDEDDEGTVASNVREADVWRDEMDMLEAEFAALAERFDRAFEEGNFPPSPGAHCSYCPRPDNCPIFPELRGAGAITDRATALRYAREAIVAKSALDSRLKAMDAWSNVDGPIDISDHKGPRAWAHVPQTRVARPKRKDMQAALDAKGIKSIDLDRLYRTDTITKFTVTTRPQRPDESTEDDDLMAALQASIDQRESKADASAR